MSEQSWVGKTLGGRYELRELLGQGGMSAVYKANDPNLRRVVAVKLIHSHLSSDPGFVHRFEEEAAAVAQLRHPNIIQVYDFTHDGDTYFIVFEFVPGETLQNRLSRFNKAGQQMPVADTIRIATDVGQALAYAHSRGLVHRDIKPANVMLNINNEAILMDFGIVKILGDDSHTATGAVLGTARYMSPEQIRSQTVDERTDIYSMGVMLFEMVGGRAPFEADSALTLIMMHVNDPVPDVRDLRPEVPADLVAIINKALAKKREDRFQTAAEMLAALGAVGTGARAGDSTVLEAAVGATMLDAARPGADDTEPLVHDTTPAGQAAAAGATVVEPQPTTGSGAKPSTAESATVLEQAPAAMAASTVVEQPPAAGVSPGAVAPPQVGAEAEGSGSGSRRALLIGGAAVALLAMICIVVIAIVVGTGVLGGGGDGDGSQTEPPIVIAQETPSEVSPELEPTPTDDIVPTVEPSATNVQPEATDTAAPTSSPTSTQAPQPTATSPPPSATSPPPPTATSPPPPTEAAEPTVLINSIGLSGDSYVVDYTPYGYEPAVPGVHIHFFFNTVPPQNAGVGPTQETWFLYGGPNPFTGYTVSDRPAGATQMCSLVANPDHTVRLNTGNCVNLP